MATHDPRATNEDSDLRTTGLLGALGAMVDRVDAGFEARVVSRPAMVVLIELFAGLGWARAVAEKVIERDWWTGRSVADFVAEHQEQSMPWYGSFIEGLVDTVPVGVAVLVLLVEVTLAGCLLTGRRLELAAWLGSALLLQFLFAGATNPAVFYLIFHAALGLWAVERRTPTRRLLAGLRWTGWACVLLVLAMLPFTETVSPAGAIDDPALVAAAWAGCVAVATAGARRRLRRRYIETTTIDLRRGAVPALAESASR